jgi:hypothetical protein
MEGSNVELGVSARVGRWTMVPTEGRGVARVEVGGDFQGAVDIEIGSAESELWQPIATVRYPESRPVAVPTPWLRFRVRDLTRGTPRVSLFWEAAR